jgi:hypothetical protein
MNTQILDQLYAPFDVKARPGQGGQTFKYVPSDDIIDRMNKVFAGKWNTKVISSEIVEDQVLIHVRVSVEDEDKLYYHDGYASQQIARFSQGPRQGQSIDIGNVYKSAMSKAIKTAVAKWGVGLYLDEKPDGGFGSNPVEGFPYSETAPAVPQEMPAAAAPAPPQGTPPQSSNPFETSGAGVPTPDMTTNSTNPFGAPDSSTVQTPTQQPAQLSTPFETAPTAPAESQNSMPAPPTSFEANTGGGQAVSEKLTDVQKTAIESSMEAHNMDFSRLIAEALPDVQSPPTTIDEVTYEQAIRLIQFNNNYSRQNR